VFEKMPLLRFQVARMANGDVNGGADTGASRFTQLA
jgi:hypothetical protein